MTLRVPLQADIFLPNAYFNSLFFKACFTFGLHRTRMMKNMMPIPALTVFMIAFT